MAITAFANPSSSSLPFSPLNPLLHHSPSSSISFAVLNRRVTASTASNNKLILLSPLALNSFRARRLPPLVASAGGSGNGGGDYGGGGGGGGGGDDDAAGRNKSEVIRALAEAGRSLDNIPKDLAAAMEAGRIPGSIATRYFELEKSPVFRWLLRFGGFKERLLADDLFLTKVAIECGVGIFTKEQCRDQGGLHWT